MESEVVHAGVFLTTILQNEYQSGDTVTLKYRHATSANDCVVASWNIYTVPFMSLGYVQVRIEG